MSSCLTAVSRDIQAISENASPSSSPAVKPSNCKLPKRTEIFITSIHTANWNISRRYQLLHVSKYWHSLLLVGNTSGFFFLIKESTLVLCLRLQRKRHLNIHHNPVFYSCISKSFNCKTKLRVWFCEKERSSIIIFLFTAFFPLVCRKNTPDILKGLCNPYSEVHSKRNERNVKRKSWVVLEVVAFRRLNSVPLGWRYVFPPHIASLKFRAIFFITYSND